ncbi:histidine triad (HIT) family protein [Halovenus aranensis]|jgi:histidine triad (HIT) family protein|uniref:Histidine triad (HIT) family protein n=1 Tax=Halovenus aranensis TaxID=890420 RepID=A0A1G8RTH7_9EURY|nr:HIT family protein [Halovenus aranensis]SDJ20239.1 histidine triad (HIT) family protein [Halovenus aranensis]
MSEKTIFEKIIEGEIPSYTVYEDETTYAFLDANPLAPGHTLVVPKEPYERLNDMPPELVGDVFSTAGEIADAVEAATDATATTLAINNGEDAGQEVPHAHLHIVPQTAEDGPKSIHRLFDMAELDDDEMADIAEEIKTHQ